MFWERFRSSIIIIIVMAVSLIIGGELLFALLLAVSIIGLTELYRVLNVNKSIPGMVGYAVAIVYATLIYLDKTKYSFTMSVIFLLCLMAAYVFCFPKYRSEQITIIFFGFFYVVVMLMFIYQVRITEGGAFSVWLIFIGAWGSDTCAYLAGRSFGKHKLAPVLSPKKSIEGSIGGIAGAALLGFLFALVFKNYIVGFSNPMLSFAIIGASSSVLSQIGDLAASAIKRNYDVKDYGKLIPGHGGILDRFDSIIFTAPVVYLLSQIL